VIELGLATSVFAAVHESGNGTGLRSGMSAVTVSIGG
jgi:hypothetical protein